MSTYNRATGDTQNDIVDQLLVDGETTDITGYQSVEIQIKQPDDTVLTDDDTGAVTIDDAATGKVRYELQDTDLDQDGRYRYEWRVTYSGGGVLTFPADTYGRIDVRDSLA